jgi:hypothetical protein
LLLKRGRRKPRRATPTAIATAITTVRKGGSAKAIYLYKRYGLAAALDFSFAFLAADFSFAIFFAIFFRS